MSSSRHFWDTFYAWSLGLGFVIIVFAGIVIAWGVAEHNITLSNPLQPVIRIMERRQVHRHEMQKLRLRAELARKGMDPDYIGFLEKKGT